MNTSAIDRAFEELINQRGIYAELGETQGYISQLRFKLKNGTGISTDLKLRMLQKSGWKQPDELYGDADMISLIKFTLKQSQAAKEHGAEYIFEKWKGKN